MELQDFLSESTLRVGSGDRAGTGFFVAPGLVVTAAHLVEDPSSGFPLVEVPVSRPGSGAIARVVRYAASPDPDLAILEVDLPSPAAAYMYAPTWPGDRVLIPLGEDPDRALRSRPASVAGTIGHRLRLDAPLPPLLEGAPVLNLRTGGVAGVVIAGSVPAAGGERFAEVTSVSEIVRLFPDVALRHDRHHLDVPAWFAATGFRGTVFAAREHILATRDTCETPIQPLITPRNLRPPMDLLAPVRFLRPGGAGRGPELSIDEVLERSRAGLRSVLLTGPTGSGRSSVLRALGYRMSKDFGHLGAQLGSGVFPILLRANQLARDGGAVEEALLASMAQGNEAMPGLDLPPTFLTDLARSPGVRLLLMIDGMDEIQNTRDIADLVGMIGRIQESPGFGSRTQLLVTARPSAAEHFRYSKFDVCEILPLGPDSIALAADRWLGDGRGFLEQNAALVESGLLASPLVLAVALKLFETEPRPLPRRMVDLFGTLISDLALERREELAGKYGPDVADHAVALLGYVALELLRSGTVMDESWLRSTAARYFEEHLGSGGEAAKARAASFTHFAAADSHFIGPAGSRFFWSHLSFRDYFAASCLVELAGEGAAVEIRRRWFDSNWGRTPSFALQLLGSEAVRLEIVREIMASGRPARFTFMTGLLREGFDPGSSVIPDFVGQLAAEVRENAADLPEAAALDCLLSLAHIPEAREALGGLGVVARQG